MHAKAPRGRNQKLYHEASEKLDGGPGGLHCDCCHPGNFAKMKDAKRFLHRTLRRVLKHRLHVLMLKNAEEQ